MGGGGGRAPQAPRRLDSVCQGAGQAVQGQDPCVRGEGLCVRACVSGGSRLN